MHGAGGADGVAADAAAAAAGGGAGHHLVPELGGRRAEGLRVERDRVVEARGVGLLAVADVVVEEVAEVGAAVRAVAGRVLDVGVPDHVDVGRGRDLRAGVAVAELHEAAVLLDGGVETLRAPAGGEGALQGTTSNRGKIDVERLALHDGLRSFARLVGIDLSERTSLHMEKQSFFSREKIKHGSS